MKLNHLRDVVAIAERGSLHAAARQLQVTQPALTRSIHELERDLGVPLFERRSKGVVATAMGELFVQRARAILSELAHARDEIVQLHGSMQGGVRVCIGSMPHMTLLPQALKAFRARYPGVHLDIMEGRFPTAEASLRAGIVDCFVGPAPSVPPGKDLTIEELFNQQGVILCRKGHPLEGARSLRDLVGAEWLSTSVTIEPKTELAALFARHGLPEPRLAVQSHSALTILMTVGNSDLLVMTAAPLGTSKLGRLFLRRIKIVEAIPESTIVIVRRVGLPLTPAAEYFCDMIRRAASQFARVRPKRTRVQS